MKESGIDKNRIKAYFDSEAANGDEAYVTRVFSDPRLEWELRQLLSDQFFESLKSNPEIDRNLDGILHRLHYDINMGQAKKPQFRGQRLAWLSSVAAVLFLSLFIWWGTRIEKQSRSNRETWVEVKAPAWSRVQFTLPDGSSGWLNNRSSIRYRGDFITDREIALNGEAYFDVEHDARHPFRVLTPEVQVNVMGTRFNIASYENEKTVEVLLVEGSLSVSKRGATTHSILKPNELAIFDSSSTILTTAQVNARKYVAWTEGKLVFRNDPIDVIARQLERYYNVEVQVNIANPEAIRWRATFSEESLEEVLKLLKRSLRINYRIETREILPDANVPLLKVILTNP